MGAIIIALAIIIYFVPTFIAGGRSQWAAIFALNLLLGWTLLGWVAALVWALALPRPIIITASGTSCDRAIADLERAILLGEKGEQQLRAAIARQAKQKGPTG